MSSYSFLDINGLKYFHEKLMEEDFSKKQDLLESGENIKTINNQSLLGSGNITISSGGTATDVQINGTSIVSSNTANIRTNGTYNASTNKLATMDDLPIVPSDIVTDSSYVHTDNNYTTTEKNKLSGIASRSRSKCSIRLERN